MAEEICQRSTESCMWFCQFLWTVDYCVYVCVHASMHVCVCVYMFTDIFSHHLVKGKRIYQTCKKVDETDMAT